MSGLWNLCNLSTGRDNGLALSWGFDETGFSFLAFLNCVKTSRVSRVEAGFASASWFSAWLADETWLPLTAIFSPADARFVVVMLLVNWGPFICKDWINFSSNSARFFLFGSGVRGIGASASRLAIIDPDMSNTWAGKDILLIFRVSLVCWLAASCSFSLVLWKIWNLLSS